MSQPNQKKPVLILGIDPGSQCTGYGVIQLLGSQLSCIAYGQIRPRSKHVHFKLGEIAEALKQMIQQYMPAETAVEQIFTCHNAQSALKLGQARGVALAAIAGYQLPLFEYTARHIKQAIVGYGAAEKVQVQRMVTTLLGLTEIPPPDAADALGVAICHASHRRFEQIREVNSGDRLY